MDIYEEISAIRAQLDRIERLLNAERNDRMFTLEQAAGYLNIEKSTLYKRTHRREIPFHKIGKQVYFFLSELEAYLKTGRQKTAEEIECEADTYLATRNGK